MTSERLLQSMVMDLWQDLQQPGALLQLGVIAACLGLAWWRARAGLRHARALVQSLEAQEALARLMFPVFALILVALAKPIAAQFMKTNLLRVAITLLVAYSLIQAAVYAVSRITRTPVIAALERVLVLSIWIGTALYVTGYWVDVIELLESIKFPMGKQKVDLWTLISAAFWVIVTLLIALWLGGVMESRLLHQESMDPSLRAVLGRVLRALMLVIGVLIGLGLVGLDLTALSVFGGALGVGLGLGFQRIASNYVSGFIVLLERMVRIGDMVKVDQFSGRVQTISTRYTVLRGLDGIDNIVPNELLTSLAVQNFSRAGALRLKVVVQIAYESDFDRAAQLAQEAALATPRVLATPAPLVVIKQMAATGIELELGFSIADPENGQDVVRSAITQSMLSKFAASGISVPFAQREVSALDARQTDGDSAPPAHPAKGV